MCSQVESTLSDGLITQTASNTFPPNSIGLVSRDTIRLVLTPPEFAKKHALIGIGGICAVGLCLTLSLPLSGIAPILSDMFYLNTTDPYRIFTLTLGHYDHVRVKVQGAARHPLAIVTLRMTMRRVGNVFVEVPEVAES